MGEIATLTHARLRAAQGDVAGARRIVAEILRHTPGHAAALALWSSLESAAGTERAAESEPALTPPEAARPSDLVGAFRARLGTPPAQPDPRVVRLEDWLRRIRPPR